MTFDDMKKKIQNLRALPYEFQAILLATPEHDALYLENTRSVYKHNLALITIVLGHKECVVFIRKARRLAGISLQDIKQRKSFWKKIDKITYFLPQSYLEKTGNLHEFTAVIETIIKKWHLPENFFNYIKRYIFSNTIDAPHTNFEITQEYDLKTGIYSVPQVYRYRELSKYEKKISDRLCNNLYEVFFPLLFSIKQVEKPKLEKYLKIERASKNKRSKLKSIDPATGEKYYKHKVIDNDIAEKILRDITKTNSVRRVRQEMKKRKALFE